VLVVGTDGGNWHVKPGRVLEEALWPAWLKHWPVRHVTSWQLPRPADWKPPGWPDLEPR